MLLVEYARDVVGMPMGSLQRGQHIGWTTDETKRDLMVAAGASCTTAACTNGRVLGYEVHFAVGREKDEALAA